MNQQRDICLARLFDLKENSIQLLQEVEAVLAKEFIQVDERACYHQGRVLKAFQHAGIQSGHLLSSTGYGYDDWGREGLAIIMADLMGMQQSVFSPLIASGTHALAVTLFGLLRPGDTLLYATGKPYDTLESTIGITPAAGSLAEWGVGYQQIELSDQGALQVHAIQHAVLADASIRVVAFQRSAGYAWRPTLCLNELKRAIHAIKETRTDTIIMVDNCYGEFTDLLEPGHVGADVAVGSLIKNPGGGLAPTGAYIAGTAQAMQHIEARLTAPGVGAKIGSYEHGYRSFYQGLFMAPAVTAAAMKTAMLFGAVFSRLGYQVMPAGATPGRDIIQAIRFDDAEMLIAFCQAIQKAAPVDSMAEPVPCDMPGYVSPVIMAAGAFVQGASIELSADGPVAPPYIGYMQGALTYEHGRIACLLAMDRLLRKG